jgi:hypothetical protein
MPAKEELLKKNESIKDEPAASEKHVFRTEGNEPHRQRRLSAPFIVAMLAVIAVLCGLVFEVAAKAQATSTFGGSVSMVRGYLSTSSTTSVVLMDVKPLGTVEVDCSGGLSRIAFYPSVSGSLWFTHEGSTGFAGGSSGTQLSNQATSDVITAQFATATHTATMVISGQPGATCTYSGQATIQP